MADRWRGREPRANRPQRVTLAGDKDFDAQDFAAELRGINVTSHLAQNTDGRRKARHRGLSRTNWQFNFTAAACNLICLPKLLAAT